jgi:hypothetical protein
VDLASSVLPAFVTGSIAGAAEGERVGLVVNARIRAIATTFSDDGAVRFATMIPPASLRQGRNSIALVALEGSSESPRLVTLGTAAEESFRLVERDGRQLIVSSTGREVPVEDGVADGVVDGLDPATALVFGWAVDPEAEQAADRVIVFDGDRFLGEAPVERPRLDLEKAIGPWATGAGFHVTIPADAVDAKDLRVFALVNGRASELPQ